MRFRWIEDEIKINIYIPPEIIKEIQGKQVNKTYKQSRSFISPLSPHDHLFRHTHLMITSPHTLQAIKMFNQEQNDSSTEVNLMRTSSSCRSLPMLPCELLLRIFFFLDIPDLLSLSRTMHYFRKISLDPLLHAHRLHFASIILSRAISSRPSLTELMARQVYITRTTKAALRLGRSFITIELKRLLERRPSMDRLVELGVLPVECSSETKIISKSNSTLYLNQTVEERARVDEFFNGVDRTAKQKRKSPHQ